LGDESRRGKKAKGIVVRSLVLDCETTGLIQNSVKPLSQQPSIIEYFGQIVEGTEVVEELEFFCDPGFPVSEEITRITGIKPEQVKGQPLFSHFADQVKEQIESVDEVVAHNMSYDRAMVNFEMKRAETELIWPANLICTVEGTEHLKGHRLNLSALHEFLFGEPFTGAHRARVDVAALTRCFIELRERGEL